MLPPFLLFLLAAIGSILISLRASHEISRLLAGGSAILCLIFGFAMAPWPIQLLIFFLVLKLERLYPWRRLGEVTIAISSPYTRRR